MNMDLQNKCTQLVENYRIMRKGNIFEYQAIIAAGAVVPSNQVLEPGVYAGVPAKKI